MDPLPLEGIRVLALENFIAGPMASMWLADAGAEVVKVERPGSGDQARDVAPVRQRDGRRQSMAFVRANRNKRSLTLDIKSEAGREVLLELIGAADIVLENLNPTALARLGLDHDSLRPRFPRLIYVSVSGFGRSLRPSPLMDRTAFDVVGQAMSGLMWRPEGAVDQPRYLGFPLADIYAATVAVSGTYQALFHRERTGRGAYVDVSLVDGAVALNELSIVMRSMLGAETQPGLHALAAPFGAYRARDGYVVLGVLGEAVWRRFVAALGIQEAADRPEFADGVSRHRHSQELMALVQPWLDERDVAEVVDTLAAYDVPAAPVLDVDGLLASDHLQARGMLLNVDDPVWGPVMVAGNPLKTSIVPTDLAAAAPGLGADTEQVLSGWLGMGEARLAALRDRGVI